MKVNAAKLLQTVPRNKTKIGNYTQEISFLQSVVDIEATAIEEI